MERGRGGHTYQGPSIEDPMERGKEGKEGLHILGSIYSGSYGEREGSHILGSIYSGSYEEKKGLHILGSIYWGSYGERE